jgi:hypothetical protein
MAPLVASKDDKAEVHNMASEKTITEKRMYEVGMTAFICGLLLAGLIFSVLSNTEIKTWYTNVSKQASHIDFSLTENKNNTDVGNNIFLNCTQALVISNNPESWQKEQSGAARTTCANILSSTNINLTNQAYYAYNICVELGEYKFGRCL